MRSLPSVALATTLLGFATMPVFAQQQIMDAEFNAQWGLSAIGVQYALEKGLTGAGIGVGVVDGYFQTTHPEFAGRIFPYSYNPDGEPVDSHGTHVAGIIGAGRNGFGMEGVAPGVLLAPISISNWETNVAGGYRGALAAGLRIFNNSWGPPNSEVTNYTPATAEARLGADLIEAFREALRQGSVLVWATGNESHANPGIPSGLPYLFPELKAGWIDVTAVDKTLKRASYADACGVSAMWCIAAPGDEIYSTIPSGYGNMSGTSMAAPHVTGTVALARQMFPNAEGAQLADIVLRTATDIGDPGVDTIYGWGLLNVGNLVRTTDETTGSAFTNSAFSRFAATETVLATLWDRSAQRIMGGPGTTGPVAVAQSSSYTPAMALGGPISEPSDAVLIASGRGPAVWAQGLGAQASIDQSASSAKASVDLGGVIGGYELLDEGPWHAGVALAYTRSSLGGADDSSADGWHGFAYATWMNNGWFVDGVAGGNWFGNDYQRRNISGVTGTVLGNAGLTGYSSNNTAGFASRLSAGRLYSFRDYTLLPYAYGTVLHQKTGSASESGADIFSLSVKSSSLDQVEGGIGTRAQLEGLAWYGFSILPSVDVAYGRLGGDVAFPVSVELLGTPIAAHAGDIGKDVLRVGTQLNVIRFDEAVGGFIAYDGRFQQNARNNSFSGGLMVRF